MRARERIVRERFADYKCAHCGATYPGEGVVILARRSSTWMVMVSCSSCLRPGIFLVSFPPQPSTQYDAASPSATLSSNASIDVAAISPASLATEPAGDFEAMDALSPVSAADVNAMHEFLVNFNGNFSKLFPKPQ